MFVRKGWEEVGEGKYESEEGLWGFKGRLRGRKEMSTRIKRKEGDERTD